MKISDKIQMGSSKNVNSINIDMYKTLYLKNNVSNLNEFDINRIVNSSDLFESEREKNVKYNLYGKIEYLSLLNGIIRNYDKLSNFLNPSGELNLRNIHNTFDFYLVKPSKTFVEVIGDGLSSLLGTKKKINYYRNFEVVATPSDIHIINAGFNHNLFNEQTYVYILNKTIDLENERDGLNFPITDLYLYAKYKPIKNKTTNQNEIIRETEWRVDGSWAYIPIIETSHNVGDIIMGDVIEYDILNYTQTILKNQIHKIVTPLAPTEEFEHGYSLHWKYNPFIRLPIRKFSNELNVVDVNDSRYDIIESIPKHLFKWEKNDNDEDIMVEPKNGIAIWRDLQREGFVDIINNIENNHPFLNGCRYVYSDVVLSIEPDLGYPTTMNVFKQVLFEDNKIMGYKPTTDLNEINKPCK